MSFERMLGPLQEECADPGWALEARDNRERLRQRVEDVMDALNPRYRRALQLRFLEDRGRDDCAALMEVKLGTFDVLLLRALRAFHARWKERHSDPNLQLLGDAP